MLLNRAALFSETPLATASVPVHRSWSTSSVSGLDDTAPMELSALGEHVDHCNGSRSRWFAVQCAADRLAGFMAPRIVTTLALVALAFGVVSFVT